MIKRLFFVAALLLSVQLVSAQTMTDDQVVKMIMDQKKAGADETTIARNLLQKGATPAQIRRIKEKYEQEQKGLGAVDLTGEGGKVNRLRDEKNKKNSKIVKTNKNNRNNVRNYNSSEDNYMISSEEEPMEEDEKLKKQQADLQGEMAFLDLDSVVYYQNLLKEKEEVFGRNLFNNELLTFEPAMNIPAPADYILGAGDQVIIDVWGASQMTFDNIISPEGFIIVEGVGKVKLAGLTVAEANKYVSKAMKGSYHGSKVGLSIGEIRNVKVEIVGEVVAPGSYTISAFSTLFNALYTAGGISDLGTLRKINVYRNGVSVAEVDVYDYIVNGNNTGNIRLQDNDLVIVGPYDAIVNIQGKVKRPMMYEMKNNEPLSKLLSYTGGFTGDAYDKNIRVIRKSGREYSIHTVDKANFGTFGLMDGDSIYVDSIIPRFSNMVEIKGAVFHPGMYQMDGSIKTLLDLVEAADGLCEDAFLARAVMHRRRPDRRLEVLSIDMEGILNGTSPDIELRKEDVVLIPSMNEMRGVETLKISGEVNYPGLYEYAFNTTVEDFILQAGGLTNAASVIKVDVFRKVYDPKSYEESDTITKIYSFELKDGFVVDGTPGFVLEPFDEVHVRKSPSHNDIKSVTIKGAVNFSGDYAMRSRDYRLSDLVEDAGGISSSAYPQGARLYRVMTDEERAQREDVMKLSQIQIYDEALRADKEFDMGIADSLMNIKQGLGDVYLLDIDLLKAIKDPKGHSDVVLREGDMLVIPEYAGTVKISGDVRHPITVTYKKGEKLNYYIRHAGGYSDRARKGGVYGIYMNGGVKKISKISSRDIKPGMEIVVPSKNIVRKLSTAEIMTIGTSSMSIATMIVSIVNLLRK